MVCLLPELLAEWMFELASELTIEPASGLHVISEQVEGRVVGLGADVDGVDSCDWSWCELLIAVFAKSRDGLSLRASS